MPLHQALFVETSPAPANMRASVLGLCSDEVRLPLVPASEAPAPPSARRWSTPAWSTDPRAMAQKRGSEGRAGARKLITENRRARFDY